MKHKMQWKKEILIIAIFFLMTKAFCQTDPSQFEYDSRFYQEIITDNLYDTKNLKELGLTAKVKNIKLYLQSVEKNSKNVLEKAPEFGAFYEFDKSGRAQASYVYDDIDELKKSKATIDKKKKSYVFYNKNGVIEKEIRDAGTTTDIYDKNGNVIETIIDNTANTTEPDKDSIYGLIKYVYDKSNKILQQTEYEKTTNRDSLTIYSITNNKLDEKGNIVENETIIGKRKFRTSFEYDNNNNQTAISNNGQNVAMEYDANNSLIKYEFSSQLGEEVITYKNKKILSKEYTVDGRNNKTLAYTYKYDKNGNWIFCNIDVIIYNEKNQTMRLKYEIIREIEYYN